MILSIGPYFNHAGQIGAPARCRAPRTTRWALPAPPTAFLTSIEGAQLMERGYTFVMVDLRGFGGSSGCLDWTGPGEQADVVNAVSGPLRSRGRPARSACMASRTTA